MYDAAQLFSAYRDQLGRPVSRDSARAIVAAVVARYEGDGYLRPELTLDDSLSGRGVLRVGLHEAQVSRVIIDGDCGRHCVALESIGARLEKARPLRSNDVPDALRAMRDIAGIAVNATTRRDPSVPNAYELIVTSEYSALSGMLRMNNRGTDQVGPGFLLGQFFANGLLAHRQKLGLIFAAATDPEEYLGGGLYLDTGMGDAGTRGNALLFRSRSAPHESPVDLDDQYSRERLTLRVSHPLHQDSARALFASVAFEADDLIIDREGATLREDRLRVIEAGLRGNWRGPGVMEYFASLQVRKGLDSLGAGLQAPGLANDPRRADFLLTQFTGTVYRRFATAWTVRFDGFAQHTGYVLPDTERFKIGGDRLGRGFEVAEIAGDRGVGGKLELRRELIASQGMLGRLSAYGFYDVGTAWKQDRPDRKSATTAGTGLALQGAILTGYLEVAAPLTGADIEGRRRASVFAELSYRF